MILLSEPDKEPDLAYRHVLRVLDAVEPQASEADILEAVCYVKSPENGRLAQAYWSDRDMSIQLTVNLVEQLPRNANFEWEVVVKLPDCDNEQDDDED